MSSCATDGMLRCAITIIVSLPLNLAPINQDSVMEESQLVCDHHHTTKLNFEIEIVFPFPRM